MVPVTRRSCSSLQSSRPDSTAAWWSRRAWSEASVDRASIAPANATNAASGGRRLAQLTGLDEGSDTAEAGAVALARDLPALQALDLFGVEFGDVAEALDRGAQALVVELPAVHGRRESLSLADRQESGLLVVAALGGRHRHPGAQRAGAHEAVRLHRVLAPHLLDAGDQQARDRADREAQESHRETDLGRDPHAACLADWAAESILRRRESARGPLPPWGRACNRPGARPDLSVVPAPRESRGPVRWTARRGGRFRPPQRVAMRDEPRRRGRRWAVDHPRRTP